MGERTDGTQRKKGGHTRTYTQRNLILLLYLISLRSRDFNFKGQKFFWTINLKEGINEVLLHWYGRWFLIVITVNDIIQPLCVCCIARQIWIFSDVRRECWATVSPASFYGLPIIELIFIYKNVIHSCTTPLYNMRNLQLYSEKCTERFCNIF